MKIKEVTLRIMFRRVRKKIIQSRKDDLDEKGKRKVERVTQGDDQRNDKVDKGEGLDIVL